MIAILYYSCNNKSNLKSLAGLLILLLCLISCNNKSSTTNGTTTPQTNQPNGNTPLELPEPSVGDPSRFKITELSTATHKVLKLKDNIIFTGLKNLPTDDVTIVIKSHCIIHKEEIIIKEYKRPLTTEIPLIEILPKEVLLHLGMNTPSCGFSFKATNQSGSAHHFELPQLPIEDYRKSHSLQITPRVTDTAPFFNVFMENLLHYHLNKSTNNKISYLNLVCDDFELPLEIFEQQQFIPLSVFAYDSLPQETQDKIYTENPVQICRILGYESPAITEKGDTSTQTLTGVSAFFKLVFPTQPLLIYQASNPKMIRYSDVFFEEIGKYTGQTINLRRMKNDLAKRSKRLVNIEADKLYSITIRNNRSYPVPIFISKKSDPLLMNTYTMYFFYTRNTTDDNIYKASSVQYTVHINSIQNGESVATTKEGETVVLNPSGELKLSILLKTAPEMCRTDLAPKDTVVESLRWMGTWFEYPELNIFELAHQDIDTIPFQWNIVRKLRTTAFPDSSHLMIFSRNNVTKHRDFHEDAMWFLEGDCFKKLDTFSYNKAFISFGRDPSHSASTYGKWSAQWEEPHTFDEKKYGSLRSRLVRSFRD